MFLTQILFLTLCVGFISGYVIGRDELLKENVNLGGGEVQQESQSVREGDIKIDETIANERREKELQTYVNPGTVYSSYPNNYYQNYGPYANHYNPNSAPASTQSVTPQSGTYIATISYGPNTPSLIYLCTLTSLLPHSALHKPNTVQGPYGYTCTVSYGQPGLVNMTSSLDSSSTQAPQQAIPLNVVSTTETVQTTVPAEIKPIQPPAQPPTTEQPPTIGPPPIIGPAVQIPLSSDGSLGSGIIDINGNVITQKPIIQPSAAAI